MPPPVFTGLSLLPICGKIFERLLYETLFNIFLRIMYFLQIILYSDQEILASINFSELIVKSLVLLIRDSKFVGYFLILPKLLAKYGMIN